MEANWPSGSFLDEQASLQDWLTDWFLDHGFSNRLMYTFSVIPFSKIKWNNSYFVCIFTEDFQPDFLACCSSLSLGVGGWEVFRTWDVGFVAMSGVLLQRHAAPRPCRASIMHAANSHANAAGCSGGPCMGANTHCEFWGPLHMKPSVVQCLVGTFWEIHLTQGNTRTELLCYWYQKWSDQRMTAGKIDGCEEMEHLLMGGKWCQEGGGCRVSTRYYHWFFLSHQVYPTR